MEGEERPAAVGLKKGDVELRPHDPAWVDLGREETLTVADALGVLALDVEHVGSTSVPGLSAKPIIDVAVRLANGSAAHLSSIRERMIAAGYIDRGLATDGGGWFFVHEAAAGFRVAHIHLVAADDPEWKRYLLFRDALRASPALRETYAELKRDLAGRYPTDRRSYTAAKTEFVLETLRQHLG
jgi:GrpB-like predicted nucleotidyltransferase (UPF0157 family)